MTGLRLRHVAEVNPSTPQFDAAPADAEVTFVPLEAVWPRALDVSRTRTKADVAQGYTRFCEGDVLVPKITPTFEADRSTIAVGLRNGFGAGTTELHVVRPGPSIDGRYVNYLVSSRGFLLGGEAEMIGVAGQKRVPDAWLRNFHVPIQSSSAQRAIADFLDRETARIDALITKKRRMISLLNERSMIGQIELVTGRVGGGPLRASGLEWLGDIPPHWSVERLKHLARPESGHTPSRSRPELWEDCTVPWITLNDVGHLAANEFITETVNLISAAGLAASSARVLPAGTVVLSRDATIGRVGIMSCPMATSQHFVDWVCGPRLKPRFLWLLFRTAMQGHFDSLTDGATLRTIGMPDVLAFSVPLPPEGEQEAIVKSAEAHRTRAHATTAALRRQIELLQEHRQALITAAVTGELKVAGVAA